MSERTLVSGLTSCGDGSKSLSTLNSTNDKGNWQTTQAKYDRKKNDLAKRMEEKRMASTFLQCAKDSLEWTDQIDHTAPQKDRERAARAVDYLKDAIALNKALGINVALAQQHLEKYKRKIDGWNRELEEVKLRSLPHKQHQQDIQFIPQATEVVAPNTLAHPDPRFHHVPVRSQSEVAMFGQTPTAITAGKARAAKVTAQQPQPPHFPHHDYRSPTNSSTQMLAQPAVAMRHTGTGIYESENQEKVAAAEAMVTMGSPSAARKSTKPQPRPIPEGGGGVSAAKRMECKKITALGVF